MTTVACTTDNNWKNSNSIHPDLILSRDLIFNPCVLECSEPIAEKESAEYGAYSFTMNAMSVQFRVAKITPTKVGQFVTVWKRVGNGPIAPYDFTDDVDLVIIATRKDENFGHFVFPKAALCNHDIMSTNGVGGKRGIRVYPPWDTTTNPQAKKTQAWQLQYFLEINKDNSIDQARTKPLYTI